MTTGQYEFIRAYSRPGESQVIFMARDSMPSSDIPELWYQVRKKIGDIRPTLPEGVVGPFFNDEFGDTFGNIYALTGEGFDYAVLKDYAERMRTGTAARARRRQDRAGRPAGREDLDRGQQHAAGHARHPAGGGEGRAGAAERRAAGRLLRDRQRPRAAARRRRLRLGGVDPRVPDPRRRPHVPPRRRRRRASRLQRSRPRRRCASWARTRSASPSR